MLNTNQAHLNVELNITKNLKNQFQRYFKLKEVKGEYLLDSNIGGGQGMEFLEFPDKWSFIILINPILKFPST